MQNMSDKILPINEIYTCLQGEGKLMGIPHILIRVSGCRLRCQFANSFCDTPYITIETEGSEFVSTMGDLISLSPKLSNSTPKPGTIMPYTGKVVTEKDKVKHEKWRCNYEAMSQLIENHPDYQLKPVISSEEDLEEVKELQKILGVPNNMVYLMPEGLERHQLNERRKWLTELCVREGYNFTDRLHIITYGDERGV